MDKTYALIENNFVVNVVIASDEWVALQSGTWIEYTDKNPAAIGDEYDSTNKVFVQPPPLPIVE